jgi:DNA-directed RNA polymerase specialized sigma24 family protein
MKILSIIEERALVFHCIKKQQSAWDTFVDQYAKLIYNVIYRTFGLYGFNSEENLVEDLYQEVFLTFMSLLQKS